MNDLFGTDGVRGRANVWPMTAELAMQLGVALGHWISTHPNVTDSKRVIIGKDTRLSCYMLENALAAGLMSAGMHVLFLGPVPTPAVSVLTRSLRAAAGIVISASHNPATDNGIKIFNHKGQKICDDTQNLLNLWTHTPPKAQVPGEQIGKAKRIDDAGGRYSEWLKASLPRNTSLRGMKIVMDGANGAAYKIGPNTLWELGATVIAMGNEPNGLNINAGCGSTHPEKAAQRVLDEQADWGIVLDGDADRVILIDRNGQIGDGDQILAFLAEEFHKRNLMETNLVAGTVMSNGALDAHLARHGLRLIRSDVGDRALVKTMIAHKAVLGSEPSGHVIVGTKTGCGDGLMAALHTIALAQEAGLDSTQALRRFEPWTNLQHQFHTPDKSLFTAEDAHIDLNGFTGRILFRPSGTEPCWRLMVEHKDQQEAREALNRLCEHLTHLLNTRANNPNR